MSPEYLLKIFHYDKEEGALYWASSRPKSDFSTDGAYKTYMARFAGKRAGCIVENKTNTYRQIRVNRKLCYEHRLIWYIETGEFCEMVDHKDGDGLNNRFSNLLKSDHTNNGKNCRINSSNTSGVNGVWWHKINLKWIAEGHYTKDGKRVKKSLGSYSTIEEAKAARASWDAENDYTQRHGK